MLQFFSSWSEEFFRRTLPEFCGIVDRKMCSLLQRDSISMRCNEHCMQNSNGPMWAELIRFAWAGQQYYMRARQEADGAARPGQASGGRRRL